AYDSVIVVLVPDPLGLSYLCIVFQTLYNVNWSIWGAFIDTLSMSHLDYNLDLDSYWFMFMANLLRIYENMMLMEARVAQLTKIPSMIEPHNNHSQNVHHLYILRESPQAMTNNLMFGFFRGILEVND
ncbi:hypothetical protein ACJX0J_040570, partial [Zea mays]